MPSPFTTSHSWVVRLVGIPRILATVSACRKVSPSSTQFIKMMLSTSELTLNSPIIDDMRSEEHTSELQSREQLVCRPLLEKKKLRALGYRLEVHLQEAVV